jgi:hypothetical protein
LGWPGPDGPRRGRDPRWPPDQGWPGADERRPGMARPRGTPTRDGQARGTPTWDGQAPMNGRAGMDRRAGTDRRTGTSRPSRDERPQRTARRRSTEPQGRAAEGDTAESGTGHRTAASSVAAAAARLLESHVPVTGRAADCGDPPRRQTGQRGATPRQSAIGSDWSHSGFGDPMSARRARGCTAGGDAAKPGRVRPPPLRAGRPLQITAASASGCFT